MYIEVKTTTQGPKTDFLLSVNEVAFSAEYDDRYRLYRLYHFNETTNAAKFFILEGNIAEKFSLTPTEFRVSGF